MLNHVRKKYSIFASGILALLLSFSVFSHAYALSSYSSVSSINSGSLLSQPIKSQNATNLNEHDDNKEDKNGSHSNNDNQSGDNGKGDNSKEKKTHGKKLKITAKHDEGGSTQVNEDDGDNNNNDNHDENDGSNTGNDDSRFFPTEFNLKADGGIAIEKGRGNQDSKRFDNASLDFTASADRLDDNNVIIALKGSITLDHNNKFTTTEGHGIIVFFKNPNNQFFRGIFHIAGKVVNISDGSERKFHLRAFLLPPSSDDKQGVWSFVVSPAMKLGPDIVIFRLFGQLIDLTAGGFDHFEMSPINSQVVAGKLFDITVAAKDSNGKTVKSYDGKAQIADLSGTVIPSITPNFHEGVFVGKLNITKSYASDKVTFKDVASGMTATSQAFNVVSDSIAQVVLTPETITITPSANALFTAKGLDRFANEITSSSLTLEWSLSSSSFGSIATSGNKANFTASTIAPPGANVTLTVRIDGTSIQDTSKITIVPTVISLEHFTIDHISGTKTAGALFQITVRAVNVTEGPISNYSGPMRLTDTTGTLNMTVNSGFSNGVWTGNVNITNAASNVKITAKDVSNPAKTGSSNAFEVGGGTLVQIELTPSEVTINPTNKTNFTVKTFDKFGNEITSAGLTFQWSLSSPDYGSISTSGSNASFTASSTLIVATNVTLTVKLGSLEDTSKIMIKPKTPVLTLDHFVVDTIPISEKAGLPFHVSFKAVTSTGATVTTYSGPFDMNDTTSTLSIVTNGGFLNGVWTGTVKVTKPAMDVTITVKDGAVPTKMGISNPFEVKAGNIDRFDFTIDTGQKIAGAEFSVTVTAKDAHGNTIKEYNGTVSLSSNDGSSPAGNASKLLPSPYTYNSVDQGQHIFKVTLYNAKSGVTITASDGTKTSTSNSFDEVPSTIAKVAITPHAVSLRAGDKLTFKAKALDVYGNTISGASFSWSVSPTSPIAIGVIPSTSGPEVEFTAAIAILLPLTGSITATSGSVTDTASITVTL